MLCLSVGLDMLWKKVWGIFDLFWIKVGVKEVIRYLALRSASCHQLINCQILKFKFILLHWREKKLLLTTTVSSSADMGRKKLWSKQHRGLQASLSINQLSNGLPSSSSSSSSYCLVIGSDNNSTILIRLGSTKSYEMFSIAVSNPPSIHQLSNGLPSSTSSSCMKYTVALK